MATKKSSKNDIPVAGIAAGVAAAAAAAGTAYYFYGSKHAKSHRKIAAKWANDMKRDVIREAKKLQKLDDQVIHGVVDRVADAYRATQSVDPEEIRRAAKELKDNWRMVQREMKGGAKKTTKRATKKSTKKRAGTRR